MSIEQDIAELLGKGDPQAGKLLYETYARWLLGVCLRYVGDHFFDCEAGISVASVLIDGSISACTSIRSDYHQGNIYHDDLMTVWNEKFEPYRKREWTRTMAPCSECKLYRYCEGGGMHQRGENGELIGCRMRRL